ncbi:MAG: glycosyltransferase [Acidobacteria bacterium]|nr:glycosyltransferase [Acidobacteriota bacterium]
MSEQPLAVIYRHELLPYSETFIREQAGNLRRYQVQFAGLRRVEGLELPSAAVHVASDDGRAGQARFLFSGRIASMDALRPALVHAHFEGGGIAAMLLARRFDVPLVVTCHGWDVTVDDRYRWPNPLLRAWYQRRRRALQREGAVFIAVSAHIKDHMLRLGYPEARIAVQRIGVDCEKFKEDHGTPREPIVLFAGRLVEKKGCGELIEAMHIAKCGARVVVIGDGPLRAHLEGLARERYPATEFLGRQSPETVREWMSRARVLCVPTVRAANGDMDGCAMVFAEAQAMGLPVVSYANGGTLEAVVSGRTGILVEERDRQGLAAAIDQLVEPPASSWAEMSRAARVHALAKFDIAKQTALLEKIYDGVRR